MSQAYFVAGTNVPCNPLKLPASFGYGRKTDPYAFVRIKCAWSETKSYSPVSIETLLESSSTFILKSSSFFISSWIFFIVWLTAV